MSDENVELVRRGFMATMEEDWPTALATLDAGDDQVIASRAAVGLPD